MKRKLQLKKLLYKSIHRGSKETDLLIGNFAKDYLDKFNDNELDEFRKILEFADSDINDWYTKKTTIPENVDTKLIRKLMNYKLFK